MALIILSPVFSELQEELGVYPLWVICFVDWWSRRQTLEKRNIYPTQISNFFEPFVKKIQNIRPTRPNSIISRSEVLPVLCQDFHIHNLVQSRLHTFIHKMVTAVPLMNTLRPVVEFTFLLLLGRKTIKFLKVALPSTAFPESPLLYGFSWRTHMFLHVLTDFRLLCLILIIMKCRRSFSFHNYLKKSFSCYTKKY